jgi:hypothetical protein
MASASTSQDLYSVILKTGSYCLNEDSKHPSGNLYMGDHTLFLQSDTDEQLLIHIVFNQTVSLKTISLGIPSDESCPHTIKLFVNKPSAGFSDVSGSTQSYV